MTADAECPHFEMLSEMAGDIKVLRSESAATTKQTEATNGEVAAIRKDQYIQEGAIGAIRWLLTIVIVPLVLSGVALAGAVLVKLL